MGRERGGEVRGREGEGWRGVKWRRGEGEGWRGVCTGVSVISTSVAVVCFVPSVQDAAQSGASKGAAESSALSGEWCCSGVWYLFVRCEGL